MLWVPSGLEEAAPPPLPGPLTDKQAEAGANKAPGQSHRAVSATFPAS